MKIFYRNTIVAMTLLLIVFTFNNILYSSHSSGKREFITEIQINNLLNKWVEMWNSYDIKILSKVFQTGSELTYLSSERNGLIKGYKAVTEHHRGFGFVEGGKVQSNRLWLEDIYFNIYGSNALVTAVWFFEQKNLRIQKGPVTFFIRSDGGKLRFSHLHFANSNTEISGSVQAVSSLGRVLKPPVLNERTKNIFVDKLTIARNEYMQDPENTDILIWYGRRVAYMGEYREAVNIFSKGINKNPNDARLYRHRGHRYISLREFDKAIADLEHAARLINGTEDMIEPDGIPNKKNIPLSTLHSNVWYHLGLAYYLKGDLENALESYKECMKVSKNDDMKTATSHWLYMTLRLNGKEKEAADVLAPITKKLIVIENTSYYRLLLFYKGLLSEKELLNGVNSTTADPALIYGLGNWYYYNGNREKGVNLFKQLVLKGNWAAFGSIAAEVQLSRM